ncbi:MAG: DivIVA domain-containing protein [Oscillospiraceae bacterium]|nr:DivIVA domain-containing protein [Oscillospiraceae bacterium]
MAETMTTTSTDINFTRQRNGYDKEQVDSYVSNLTKAYRTAYDEYNTVCEKYNCLLEDYNELETKAQETPDTDVIAKTLVDMEILAHKVMADAGAEAEKTLACARDEAMRIIDEAMLAAADSKESASKILDAAAFEESSARARAVKIIDDAKAEAEQINRRAGKAREASHDLIRRTMSEMESILDGSAHNCERTQLPVREKASVIPIKTANVVG